MDDRQSKKETLIEIPLVDKVFRHGLKTWHDKEDEFQPSASFFDLTPADIASGFHLSVEWDKKTTPEQVIARVGASFKMGTEEFKNYQNRVIYALEVKFLRSLSFIVNVVHAPSIKKPEKIGHPNNIAHSLISFHKENYAQNRGMILDIIRKHAKGKNISFDMKEVDKMVEMYRSKKMVVKKKRVKTP